VAACGFAHRRLGFDSAARRYLTQAVFPLYILHQTLIIVCAHGMKPAGLASPVEALVLAVPTLGGGFGLFGIIRRVSVLRPLKRAGR
jgi:hypothetical protein